MQLEDMLESQRRLTQELRARVQSFEERCQDYLRSINPLTEEDEEEEYEDED